MAHETTASETSSADMDYAQHNATWHVFTNMVKWGIIGCAILVIALYLVINP